MSDLRRLAAWILVLAIVVFAGDRVGARLCRRILLQSQFRFSQVYRAGGDADVLVTGDSRAMHAFHAPTIARLTGRPVLNLAFNSMSMPIAEALLADYLDRHSPPRLAIVEVTSVFVKQGLVAEMVTYSGLSSRLEALYARSHPRAAALRRVFRLLPYNNELFLRASLYLRRSDQDWINRGIIAPGLAAGPPTRWSPQPLPGDLEALGRIVALLQARGVAVRLVISPYHPAAGMVMDAVVSGVTRAAHRADPSARVWNYVDAIEDSIAFSDRVHLNATGSERFLQMLQRDGVLTSADVP